jgi:hypothetical protein
MSSTSLVLTALREKSEADRFERFLICPQPHDQSGARHNTFVFVQFAKFVAVGKSARSRSGALVESAKRLRQISIAC